MGDRKHFLGTPTAINCCHCIKEWQHTAFPSAEADELTAKNARVDGAFPPRSLLALDAAQDPGKEDRLPLAVRL